MWGWDACCAAAVEGVGPFTRAAARQSQAFGGGAGAWGKGTNIVRRVSPPLPSVAPGLHSGRKREFMPSSFVGKVDVRAHVILNIHPVRRTSVNEEARGTINENLDSPLSREFNARPCTCARRPPQISQNTPKSQMNQMQLQIRTQAVGGRHPTDCIPSSTVHSTLNCWVARACQLSGQDAAPTTAVARRRCALTALAYGSRSRATAVYCRPHAALEAATMLSKETHQPR